MKTTGEIELDSEWWYLQGADKCGPVTKDELADLVRRGMLDARSLVWFKDMADWTPLGEAGELADVMALAPAPGPGALPGSSRVEVQGLLDESDPASWRPAGPWRRFWARMIDQWVLSILMVGLLTGMIAPRFSAWMSQPGADALLGFVMLPLSLVVEAAIFGLTGSTLGKSVLHVKVLTIQGHQPSFGQYLIRQAGIYWFAFALGLPLVSLITMVVQHRRVKKGLGARYDVDRFQVLAGRIGALRITVVVVAIALILLVSGMLNNVSRADRRPAQRPHASAGTVSPARPVATGATGATGATAATPSTGTAPSMTTGV